MQFSQQKLFSVVGVVLLGAIMYFIFGAHPGRHRLLRRPLRLQLQVQRQPRVFLKNRVRRQLLFQSQKGRRRLFLQSPVTQTKAASPLGRIAPELVRPTGYSNIDTLGMLSTEQFTLKRFIGKKVILLEFWTTSSLALIHTIPYLNYWYDMYKNDGLLVVGVHAPQFRFRTFEDVVDQILFSEQIHFPIVLDNEYSSWAAYKNTVWPQCYLIDINGKIAYEHSGDGAYEATQAKMMELLSARAQKLGESFTVGSFETPKNAFITDSSHVGSPDAYFGAARNKNLFGGISLKEGVQVFESQTTVSLNLISLAGSWNITKEYAQNMTENTAILYRYRAKDVFATLAAEKLTKLTVLLDGNPLDETNAGGDVRFEKGASVFYVKDARIYEIVAHSGGYGEHILTLTPENGGVHVYALMFQ